MRVQSHRVESRLARPRDRVQRLFGRQTELRAVVSGLDRVVRLGVDPGRYADERTLDTGCGRALDLVQGVEDDEAGVRRSVELLVALVVPVHDDPFGLDVGALRDLELPERRDVRAE